jgi:hypothetical protein
MTAKAGSTAASPVPPLTRDQGEGQGWTETLDRLGELLETL